MLVFGQHLDCILIYALLSLVERVFMLRFLVGVVLAGVLMHGWGMVSWMVLPFHEQTMKPITMDSPVVSSIRDLGIEEEGFYYFPPMPEDWSDEAQMEAYEAAHAEGPAAYLIVQPNPGPPMPVAMIAVGFGSQLLAALLAGLVLALGPGSGVCQRYVGVVLMGAIVAVVADGAAWNWMLYPTDYSVVMGADRVAAFALGGVPLALLPLRRGGLGVADKDSASQSEG